MGPASASTRAAAFRPSIATIAECAALAAGAWFAVAFLYVALSRIAYPFELEWMEGGTLEHVERSRAGKPLYVAPGLEFVPYIYTPLYFHVSALVSRVVGLGFLAPRLVSLLSSLATFALLFEIVWRESGSRAAGWVAATAYAATFRLSGAWMDVARVDPLFLALLLAGMLALRFGRGPRAEILAGVLFALSFLTKQTALLPAAAASLYAFRRGRSCGLRFAGTAFGIVAATTLVFDLLSDGWYRYYVFGLPGAHEWRPVAEAAFWRSVVLFPTPVFAALCAWAWIEFALRRDLDAFLFHAGIGVAALLGSWFSLLHTGGYLNVVMPAYAMLAIGAGVGFARLRERMRADPAVPPAMAAILALALLFQYERLIYDAKGQLPSDADRAVGEAILRRIEEFDGSVFVPYGGYLVRAAGKGAGESPGLAYHVFLVDDEASDRFREEVAGALAERRYDAVVLHWEFSCTDWFEEALAERYVRAGAIVQGRVFFPITGGGTRPDSLWLPKETPPEERERIARRWRVEETLPSE